MRTPLVAGNWKLNNTEDQAITLTRKLMPGLSRIAGVEKLICPPFIALPSLHKLLVSSEIRLGAQNMYWKEAGAYTGEISPKMLAPLCDYVILGHSERRAIFGETDEQINLKVKAALPHKLIPILCVGETDQENQSGRTVEVITRQIRAGLQAAPVNAASQLVVAYEPVWAIGTGRSATPEGANQVIQSTIRTSLANIFGESIADGVRVLYGGSVTEDNARSYFAQPGIDGALVGGASLRPNAFIGIAEAAR
ncbi:MAG: triose-phosphate isomerase [Chloroflexota bacterium]